jgi:hypothetical protein
LEAARLANVVHAYVQALEAYDIEKRLAKVEEDQNRANRKGDFSLARRCPETADLLFFTMAPGACQRQRQPAQPIGAFVVSLTPQGHFPADARGIDNNGHRDRS